MITYIAYTFTFFPPAMKALKSTQVAYYALKQLKTHINPQKLTEIPKCFLATPWSSSWVSVTDHCTTATPRRVNRKVEYVL